MSKKDVENNETTTEKKLGGITGKGFVPGVSGNPGGRPKEYNFKEAIKEALKSEDKHTKRENIVAIVDKAVSMAKRGNLGAIKWLADRYEGTPMQSININPDSPIRPFSIEDQYGNILMCDKNDGRFIVEKIGEQEDVITIG